MRPITIDNGHLLSLAHGHLCVGWVHLMYIKQIHSLPIPNDAADSLLSTYLRVPLLSCIWNGLLYICCYCCCCCSQVPSSADWSFIPIPIETNRFTLRHDLPFQTEQSQLYKFSKTHTPFSKIKRAKRKKRRAARENKPTD
jgi:hypothetical protein